MIFLLSKLEFYSTVRSAKALITSCIKDSYQEVLINRDSSLWGNGEPQGSILNYNRYVCMKLIYQYTVQCIVTNSISELYVRPFEGLMDLNKNM